MATGTKWPADNIHGIKDHPGPSQVTPYWPNQVQPSGPPGLLLLPSQGSIKRRVGLFLALLVSFPFLQQQQPQGVFAPLGPSKCP